MNNPYSQWKKDEQAPFAGWDFSYLKNRKKEEQPPWDYKKKAKALIMKAKAVLDMGTGGGEVFSFLAPFPKHTIAIEGWKPNVSVAKKRLEPLGIKVLEVNINESSKLPFIDGEFDLVLNRHSAFNAKEVFRILQNKGTFLTQQVGGRNLNDLIQVFDAVPQYKDWTLDVIKQKIQDAGFQIKDAREWSGKVEFKDVGALVYFLKAIPWVVKGFSVDKYLPTLKNLQSRINRGEKLIFTETRFLIQARK